MRKALKEHLIVIASTLDNWKQEIANSFIPCRRNDGKIIRLSNGKIEGKNSYIKKMITLANGYSNFERFRNRAMYCENYYETYSTEKLPNKVKRVFPKKRPDGNNYSLPVKSASLGRLPHDYLKVTPIKNPMFI
ncbi:MAG: transposase [Erysipelotrichaceae bacterium]|nr:transposase [Erysipelotrichaceae bacterium]